MTPTSGAAGRAPIRVPSYARALRCVSIGVPASHETTVCLGLMAAGFTKPERGLFMAAWDRAQGDLTPAERMLFQRFYSHAARDLGDAL